MTLTALGLLLGCQNGETITLGGSPPGVASGGASSVSDPGSGGQPNEGGAMPAPDPLPLLPLRFDDVELVSELSSLEKDDNPTLTADQLMICFTSERDGGTGDVDVWCAERSDAMAPFDAPYEVAVINSPGFESSSALDLDGLTLWVGSERLGGAGGMDIYRSTRGSRNDPWSDPELVVELNSEFDDIPRPTAMNGTVMPLGSRRVDDIYWTYLAERSDSMSPFSAPERIDELARPGIGLVDAQLSEDGLLLVSTTTSGAAEPGDLYASDRSGLAESFSAPALMEGVNTEFDDRDPWLSPDGETLYFSSDRSGEFEIYRATRVR